MIPMGPFQFWIFHSSVAVWTTLKCWDLGLGRFWGCPVPSQELNLDNAAGFPPAPRIP